MSHAMEDHPRWIGHTEEFWRGPLEKEMATHSSIFFSPGKAYEQYEKEKKNDARRWVLQVGGVQHINWGIVEGNY